MRFKNDLGVFKIYAVTGSNTVAFAIDCAENVMKNLLGFMVEKAYVTQAGDLVRVTVMGFKVFAERVSSPIAGALYSTYDNPIQSFSWEDFTAYPGNKYTYHFTPLYGTPLNITRDEIHSIEVETELAWMPGDHSIFFNRGVASSQAYANKFGQLKPNELGDDAFRWLSRGLNESIQRFIQEAKIGDTIYGCFYEFHFDVILQALKDAADSGVNLKIIYDAKFNEHKDSKTGKLVKSFPKEENEKAIKKAGLDNHPNVKLFPRETNKSYLSHNKFMVLASGQHPVSVYTGSTNISRGGIFGQSNVGHSVDDGDVASKYLEYWELLKSDLAGKDTKTGSEAIQPSIKGVANIPNGVTCFFSPRKNLDMLLLYAELLDSAKSCACITLAFNVHEYFAKALSDNNQKNALTFMLLERDDGQISDYVYKNNVVKAVGSYIGDNALYKWVKEVNTASLRLNSHVMYVHTKYLLCDPLSEHPIVVTGSANFSKAATDTNDENMMIIKGNHRVADIYFTEFLRMFNHYYFRWIVKKMSEQGTLDPRGPAFLLPNDSWTDQFKATKYKRQRIEIFSKMFIPQ